jgi:hypothetical protein
MLTSPLNWFGPTTPHCISRESQWSIELTMKSGCALLPESSGGDLSSIPSEKGACFRFRAKQN